MLQVFRSPLILGSCSYAYNRNMGGGHKYISFHTLEATSIPFGIVNAAIGIVAGYMAAHGFLRSTGKVIWLMVALTVTTIITATPIVVLVFEGVSGSGVDAVTAFFVASGQGVLESVIGQQLLTTPGDKVLTVLLAFVLIKGVPARYRPPFAREVVPF